MAGPEPTPSEVAEQQEAERRLQAYHDFFTSTSGQRVLEYMRESLDGNTFRPDPYEAAYAAGRRSVYLNILQAVGHGELLAARAAVAKMTNQPAMPARAQMPATIEEL